ncbi:hypothetical protein [Chitinophaga niabensis]|uniref:Uncharacterized protein n=1 Tax=Chitinophaga niabensis TaxID=536979 RepID=A0A1N6JNR1_9BACT|nr:hypothetical protein [Chitinophaga niabensis]SIO46034.1 hypothetical protein SAMN04488055_4226 [Chitinophaga niabensis]
MTEEAKDIISIQATAATTTDKSWLDWQQKEKQETVKRLEDTAKFLSGISSLSLSILLGVNREALKHFSNSTGLKIALCCWLLSVVFTLIVVFPFRYKYASNSADAIRALYQRISQTKFLLLVLGTLLYLAGLSMMVYFYLYRQAPAV